MTAPILYADLIARDVKLSAIGGKLRYSGVVSPEELAEMSRLKPDLLMILALTAADWLARSFARGMRTGSTSSSTYTSWSSRRRMSPAGTAC